MEHDRQQYNHHPEQFGIWFPYNGFRYKAYYNIRLADGKEIGYAYPNGEAWLHANGRVTDDEVAEIQLVDYDKTPHPIFDNKWVTDNLIEDYINHVPIKSICPESNGVCYTPKALETI